MPKTSAFETDILELIFENTDLAAVGDATGLQGSSTAGSFYIRLFTADPGAAGAITNECDYTGYAAVAVARSTAGWTTTTGVCTNDAAITFAACTAGSNTVTYFGICKTSSGDDMIYSGALTASRAVSAGITPEFAAGDITVTES